MKVSSSQIASFQHLIFTWWEKNKRDLPWRHTRDPYHIHVSEVMLQQTQVSRVLPKYHEFLHEFPSVRVLASASTGDVLRTWKGMGYNRRGLYLKKAAELVMNEHKGFYPDHEKTLLQLPGLGKYTARAILVFAYGRQLAFVDTNIRQIIEHYFGDGHALSIKEVAQLADTLLPSGRAWDWHQALMDYGSMELGKLQGSSIPPTKKKLSIPFIETNRFIRGRIMDLVREKSWNEKELLEKVEKIYDKPQDRVFYNLNNLLKEGLLVKNEMFIQLPE